jgi:hypothetical protein
MNGLDELGIAREGLQGGGLIGSEARGQRVWLHVQIRAVEPRQRVFEVAPDPFKGIQLGTVGWQEHEAYVGWKGEPLGRMGPAVVQEQEIQAVREGLGEGIDE